MIDPELCTISIRKEDIEGDLLSVGRVTELPDLKECGTSFEKAHGLVMDSLITAQKLLEEKGMNVPEPISVWGTPAGGSSV